MRSRTRSLPSYARMTAAIAGAGLALSCMGRVGFEQTEPTDLEPPPQQLGIFDITGVTGNLDTVADAWLGTTQQPTAHWSSAVAALSYDIVIHNAAGTADVCAVESATTTSHAFSSCLLSEGITYTIDVNARDAEGAVTPATNNGFSFTVDDIAPSTPVFSAPASNAGIFVSSFTFMWSSSDVGSGLKTTNTYRVEEFSTADCGGAPLSSAAQTAAAFDCVSMTSGATYSVRITAYDNAGNTSAPACSPNVTFDPTPTLVLADPVTYSQVTTTHQDVNATIGNDLGAAEWCMSETQTTAPSSGVDTCLGGAGSANGWFTTRPLTLTLSAGDGSKTVYLWLADGLGNVDSNAAVQTIILSGTQPGAFNITGVTGDLDVVADAWLGTTQQPTANWSAAAGAASYDIVVRNAAGTADVCAVEIATTTSHAFSSCLLSEGVTYTIDVDAKNLVGAGTPATNNGFSFTVDDTAPSTPVFSAPASNAGTFVSSFTFAWSSSDAGSGLKTTNTYRVEKFATVSCSGAPVSSATQTAANFNYASMTSGATYSVRITAYDNAGNTSATACSPNVTFDPAPTLVLADPVTSSQVTATHQTVNATIGSDLGAAKWCMSETQATAPSSGVDTCLGGAGSANGWFTTRPVTFTLSAGDGSKTVHLWLADSLGNVDPNGAVRTIAVGGTPGPLVFDANPKKISSLHKANTKLTGRCTEIGGGVSITGGGTASTTCAVGGTWMVTVDFTSAGEGTVTVFGVQCLASGALCSVPVSHQYTKDTAFCDNVANSTKVPFAAGDGSAGDPYLGCSEDQLAELAAYLGASFRLRNDVDEGAASWAPIGTYADPYAGTLDGNDFVIENLNFDIDDFPTGLFAVVSGTVQNLGVVNVNLTGRCHIGAIAGVLYDGGIIQYSYATGVIQADLDNVGGLVGENGGTISASYSSVRVDNIEPVDQHWYIGGLVGGNDATGIVSSSYATGNVTGYESDQVGGLVGYSSGTVTNSYATGTVTGYPVLSIVSTNLGGLVGVNGGTLQGSYSTGVVLCSGCASGFGGLLATDSGTVTVSYWDTQASGVPTSAGGTGLTTAQMQVQGSFSGWDFATVWKFDSNLSIYPVLTWQ